MAVHYNSAISSVEKFTYLRSLVEGNAARAISGLQLTSANCIAALEVLRERFIQQFTHGIVDQVETDKRDFGRQRNARGSRQSGNSSLRFTVPWNQCSPVCLVDTCFYGKTTGE